jgi:DMATS type aromatic prenyltransferase
MKLSGPELAIDAASICLAQLRTICAAADISDQQDEIATVFKTLCDVAGLQRLPVPPRWSGLSDDCTPIEFSTSFDVEGAKIRFLIEAQADPASPESYWAAGERLTAYLAETHDLVLNSLEAIKDLFSPTDPNALFAVWHSLEFRKAGPPMCKIYLNPAARGRHNDRALIVAALDRLGFRRATDQLIKLLRDDDMITHFAIDLVAAEQARVKVYVRQFRAAPSDLDRLAERIGIRAQQRFAETCDIMCPGTNILSQRPVMTCYYLTAANTGAPVGMTLYLPLHPYAPTNQVAAERIAALLSQVGLSASTYLRIADRLIGDRGDRDGLHPYVAYKRSVGNENKDQVTAYFSPTLFQPDFGRLALDPDRFWPSPVP